jgi:hypothetical protein
VYVFLAGNDTGKPWLSSAWRRISEATHETFLLGRDRPAVRSTQFGGTPPTMRELKFGRITHDAKGAMKWTHETDGVLASGDQAFFCGAEVWTPPWNACERDGTAPDVYLCISNRLGLMPNRFVAPPELNSICIFAVAIDLGSEAHKAGRAAAEAVLALLSSPVGFASKRTWGRPSGGGFTDAINDLHLVEPFRPSLREEDKPLVTLLESSWTPFRRSRE